MHSPNIHHVAAEYGLTRIDANNVVKQLVPPELIPPTPQGQVRLFSRIDLWTFALAIETRAAGFRVTAVQAIVRATVHRAMSRDAVAIIAGETGGAKVLRLEEIEHLTLQNTLSKFAGRGAIRVIDLRPVREKVQRIIRLRALELERRPEAPSSDDENEQSPSALRTTRRGSLDMVISSW